MDKEAGTSGAISVDKNHGCKNPLVKILHFVAHLHVLCLYLSREKLLGPSDDFGHKQPVSSHQAELDKPLAV